MSASFSCSFKANDAVQVIVSSAFHTGLPICPDVAAEALLAAFPECELSRFELTSAIIEAAFETGVTVVEPARY